MPEERSQESKKNGKVFKVSIQKWMIVKRVNAALKIIKRRYPDAPRKEVIKKTSILVLKSFPVPKKKGVQKKFLKVILTFVNAEMKRNSL